MPDGPVTPPVIALLGKLPAHGDFIRRGGPLALVRGVEDWLDGELAAAVARDPDGARDPGEWRFDVAVGDARMLGTIIGSGDAVGRAYPLVGLLSGGTPADFAEADRWCGEAAVALRAAQQDRAPADAALAALSAIPMPTAGGDGPPLGWWQPGDERADGAGVLPTGAAFDRLLRQVAA